MNVDVKKKVLNRKLKKRRRAKPVEDDEEPAAKVTKDSNEDGGGEEPKKQTCTKFADFPLSERTQASLARLEFVTPTPIQSSSIPVALEGKDIFGCSPTGSGKTLAFLIPAIELLLKHNWKQANGTGVMIISPTRELSIQTYGVVSEILEDHPQLSHGLIMGGANRQSEAQRLLRGVSIVVATPGRLLDHMQSTHGFNFRDLKCLIIDEADRILDIGFEQEMHQILRLLPRKRQSMLFSATKTARVDELIKEALHANPVQIGIQDREEATVEGLEQGYVACPSEKRFLLLFTFLKKNRNKKIMVFFSSCAAVKYYQELLNYIDVPVLSIHGKQKQQKRTCTFFSFCEAKTGILLCTDVAARGLDIPAVDWIVQYDPPDETREYIHRVGRTARGEGGTGHALLILRPEELGFLRFLKAANVTVNEFEFSWNKIPNIQPQLEKIIAENYYLNKSAKEGYKGYVRAYDSHSLKEIFDVNTLDLIKVSKSFGFGAPPFVDLPVSQKPAIKAREKFNGAGYKKKNSNKNFAFNQKQSGY